MLSDADRLIVESKGGLKLPFSQGFDAKRFQDLVTGLVGQIAQLAVATNGHGDEDIGGFAALIGRKFRENLGEGFRLLLDFSGQSEAVDAPQVAIELQNFTFVSFSRNLEIFVAG